ncbi:MAG: hypothetical protein KAU90_10705, partial [Sulfurovaceae bacterium]|nr:hypothetical protein [Sulfurovaceae bacterium]
MKYTIRLIFIMFITITLSNASFVDPIVDTATEMFGEDNNDNCNQNVTTIETRVSSSNDDAEESSGGSMHKDSSDLELTQDGTNHQTVGIRFQGINIPKNATITKAYIQFSVDEPSAETTNLTIYGEDSNSTNEFSDNDYDISIRKKTSTSVSWSPSIWEIEHSADINQPTPDLKALVQEIVNRNGWSSGNNMAFIITGNGYRVAESYDGEHNKAPLLHIEFNSCQNNDYTEEDNNNSTSTAVCYALTDDSDKLYKVSMRPNGNPLHMATTIDISITFNGEGSAYRASNNTFYAFKGTSDDYGPSDLYSVNVNSGATTKVKDDIISGAVDGAEFYFDPT